MRSFNNLYQFENDKDTISFNKQREKFIRFLNNYDAFIDRNINELLQTETTINEMLLQSYSGNIRVFPAIPSEWNGAFKLHAVGGFVVTAERQDSETLYVAVESKCGERCCIINPWERERVQIRDLTESELVRYSGKNEKITFNTQKDHVYLVERLTVPVTRFGHKQITGRKNRKPKKSGRAILGKPRQF